VSVAERFGANLLRERKRAGLSQEQLGFKASLHRTEISLLERGTRVPRIDTCLKLVGALGIAPADLLTGISWTPPQAQPGRFGPEPKAASSAATL